ncbi:MAG: tetratricopeptide repeat protein [Verrucomicrobiae bacterium]|nr:tetratricopeptide repeat protein [Verrucomicrobiae bacterium]
MHLRRWVTAGLAAGFLAVLGAAGAGCRTSDAGRKSATTAQASEAESEADLERRVQAHAAFAAGVLHQERDEPEAAFRQFARAAEKDPSNEPLATEVAGHYLQRNRLDDAIQVLRRTAAQPGTSGVTHTLLALTLRRSGKTNEAIAAYRDALRATPTLLAAHQELAELYLAQGRPGQAHEVIEQSLRTESDSAVHWLNTADLFAWLAQADPGSKEAADAGRRAALDRAAALKPADPGLLLRLGRARMDLGDAEAAEALIQEAGRQLPKDPAVAASMAELLIREGRLKEARESLELLSRVNPTSHFPWYFLAIVDLEEGRGADAISKFHRAIALNPDFEPAYSDLAVAQLNGKLVTEALETLTRARARFPDSHRLVLLTGVVQARAADPAEALASFEEAERVTRRVAPESLDHRFYFQAGAALERGGHIQEAERYLEKSLELKPDFDEALNHLGYMWAERGEHLDRALEMIQRAVDAEPENPAYLDSLGWVRFKLGQPAEALPWMEKAARFLPQPDATVFDHLGDVLQALGRTAEAREAWEKSLKVESSDAVRKKLSLPSK